MVKNRVLSLFIILSLIISGLVFADSLSLCDPSFRRAIADVQNSQRAAGTYELLLIAPDECKPVPSSQVRQLADKFLATFPGIVDVLEKTPTWSNYREYATRRSPTPEAELPTYCSQVASTLKHLIDTEQGRTMISDMLIALRTDKSSAKTPEACAH